MNGTQILPKRLASEYLYSINVLILIAQYWLYLAQEQHY